MKEHQPKRYTAAIAATSLILMGGCGGGSSDPVLPPVVVAPPPTAVVPPPGTVVPLPEPVAPLPGTVAPPGAAASVQYALGGTVSGLGQGAAVTIINGSEKLVVGANGSFTFATRFDAGARFDITVAAPQGYTCKATDTAGAIGNTDSGKTAVACAPVLLAGVVNVLHWPSAVTSDGMGNLYVADSISHSVLKSSRGGGFSMLAGASSRPGYVNGPAVNARFRLSNGSMFIDGQGNLFLTDGCNGAIRKVGTDGMVSTFAGGGRINCNSVSPDSGEGFGFPRRMVSDGAGGVLVTDTFAPDLTLRQVNAVGVPSVRTWDYPAGISSLWFVTIARAGDGTLYLSDGRRRIWKDVGGTLQFVAGAASSAAPSISVDGTGATASFQYIRDMVVAADGNLYVADTYAVRKVTPGGQVSTLAGDRNLGGFADGQGAAARFGIVGALALDGASLIVADQGLGVLRRVSLGGKVTTLAATPMTSGSVDGSGAAARLNAVSSVTNDAEGNLYFVDSALHVLRKATPDGSVSTIGGKVGVAGGADGVLAAATFAAPHSVAAGRDGLIWVAQTAGLRKIQNGVVTTVAPSLKPVNLTVDADGNAIVTDGWQVMRVSAAGETKVLVNSDMVGALLKKPDAEFFPHGLAVDAKGNLYIADRATVAVYKLGTSGALSLFAGTPLKESGDIDGPAGTATLGFYDYGYMTIDDKGNLYLSGQGAVRMISPTGVVSSPGFGWGKTPIGPLAYAKGKLYGMARYALLQTYLP